uniref:Uncharacterized protein n=1 Tax=Pipistrellus kuhlii TaxID=59472 RepID=A0A7J7W3A2_PIPKU|nr:hypothetical protein mPipKuh1_008211 [Pipistrellus kuhlii]
MRVGSWGDGGAGRLVPKHSLERTKATGRAERETARRPGGDKSRMRAQRREEEMQPGQGERNRKSDSHHLLPQLLL